MGRYLTTYTNFLKPNVQQLIRNLSRPNAEAGVLLLTCSCCPGFVFVYFKALLFAKLCDGYFCINTHAIFYKPLQRHGPDQVTVRGDNN